MSSSNVRIAGTGSYLPRVRVRSNALAAKMGAPKGWIEDRTGIETRHFAAAGETAASMALGASQRAVKAARIQPRQVEAVIASTLSPDRQFPGIGYDVAAGLGLRRAPVFELRAECSGFVFGLFMAHSLIRSGAFKRILLTASELQSRHLDLTARSKDVSILFGDGAGAVIVEATKPRKQACMDFEIHSDGNFAKDLCFERDSKFPFMNKTSVIVHSTSKMVEVSRSLLDQKGIKPDGIDWIIPHQSNINLIHAFRRQMGVDERRVITNIRRVGNTSSASIPIVLDEAVRTHRVKRGDLILFVGFGSGYSWGACLHRY